MNEQRILGLYRNWNMYNSGTLKIDLGPPVYLICFRSKVSSRPAWCSLPACSCSILVPRPFGSPGGRALDARRVNALDDDARDRLKRAMRDMRRRGIRPRVNSTFRSRAEQQSIYRCNRDRRCRARRGIYGARKPGHSMHEAGLAVDIGGVWRGVGVVNAQRATDGPDHAKKHGFSWPYGLRIPAHFEISPRRAGIVPNRRRSRPANDGGSKSNRAVAARVVEPTKPGRRPSGSAVSDRSPHFLYAPQYTAGLLADCLTPLYPKCYRSRMSSSLTTNIKASLLALVHEQFAVSLSDLAAEVPPRTELR